MFLFMFSFWFSLQTGKHNWMNSENKLEQNDSKKKKTCFLATSSQFVILVACVYMCVRERKVERYQHFFFFLDVSNQDWLDLHHLGIISAHEHVAPKLQTNRPSGQILELTDRRRDRFLDKTMPWTIDDGCGENWESHNTTSIAIKWSLFVLYVQMKTVSSKKPKASPVICQRNRLCLWSHLQIGDSACGFKLSNTEWGVSDQNNNSGFDQYLAKSTNARERLKYKRPVFVAELFLC